VDIDKQRYTCLSKHTFLFEQINSNFAQKIKVDKDGLVILYQAFLKEYN
jgi:hypothetical protein